MAPLLPTRLPPGMDHDLYPYRASPARPALAWPGQARLAVVVLLHLEYWEAAPDPAAVRDARMVGEYGSFEPDYRTWSQREYGNRVGLARVLEVLARYPVRLTVPLNAACVGRHDTLIAELAAGGAEFVGHGWSANHLLHGGMTLDEERAYIARALDAVAGATGGWPLGWAGQEYGESARTPGLLAEAGIRYLLDWPNDDSPYWMRTEPPLLSLPAQPEWDDVQQLWLRRIDTRHYPDMVSEACRTLAGEGGRVLVLSLHPWLMGMAHRVRYLDEALARVAACEGLWWAQAGEVARHVAAMSPAPGR